MDLSVLHKLTYGMYAVGTLDRDKTCRLYSKYGDSGYKR